MRTALFAAILLTMMFTAQAGAATDPRKCTISGTPATASYCGNLAARMAVVRKVGNGDVTCRALTRQLLRYACTFKNEATTGQATVRFRALPTGWRTVVAVG